MTTNTSSNVPSPTLPRSGIMVAMSLPMLATTGCSAIGDVFKAGAWVVFVVVAAVVAILFGVVKIFTGRK